MPAPKLPLLDRICSIDKNSYFAGVAQAFKKWSDQEVGVVIM